MRIGLVCPYSVDVPGGVQTHVLDLAEALRRRGHRVAVLAPGEHRSGLPSYVTTTGRSLAMPYNGSVARVAFGPLVAARVRRWLEETDPDVVHIHEPASPSVSVLALWAARAPVVATFHTAQERTRTLETSAALLRPALGKIRAHVAVSEAAAATMRRYIGVEPARIPNGVDLERYAGPRRTPRRPTLVFVGRLDEPRKGLTVLLAALPQVLTAHPDARLLVVGRGSPPPLPRDVARRVRHLGPVGDAAKARVLAAASAFVAPNTHGESFGIVLVEAMAAGAPVVASDLPAFGRVLEDGRCGVLVPVGDPAALAASLSALLADPLRRQLLADRGRRAVRRYGWAEVAPRIEAVYAEVAAAGSAAAG